MDRLSKVKDLKMPTTKRERNMVDASVWFRYRCKITAHIKGNKSSMYKENKQCQLYNFGENETHKKVRKD